MTRMLAMAAAVTLTLGLAAGCGLPEKRAMQVATHRVEATLKLLREGNNSSEAIAMCWWRVGNGNCEQTGEAAIAFDNWRKEHDVYRVESYRVGEVTLNGADARVACEINGRKLAILVRPGQPLAWAD